MTSLSLSLSLSLPYFRVVDSLDHHQGGLEWIGLPVPVGFAKENDIYCFGNAASTTASYAVN